MSTFFAPQCGPGTVVIRRFIVIFKAAEDVRNEAGDDMHTNSELCNKIVDLYPEIGACGIDVDVEFSQNKNCFEVHLHKDGHELSHHLEIPDADDCIDGKQCVSLGLEIAQLKNHIQGKGY